MRASVEKVSMSEINYKLGEKSMFINQVKV